MKNKFSDVYKKGSILLCGMISLFSCSLKEYNPGGTTADVVFAAQEGMNALVNSAYVNYGGQFYGREDIVMLTEGGTDLWINIANGGYGRQMTKYEELTASTGQIRNTWNRLYEIINYCNAGIERIDGVPYNSADEKKARKGELHFLRAYSYWHIVEFYGGVDLRTKETKTAVLTAQRSPVAAFYDLMLQDVDAAITNLPVDPVPTTDIGRATLKAAYGLKARIALTRVAYESSQAEKDKYYQIAKEAAMYVINNQATLKVSLYNNPADVFSAANNKNNKEAMFVVTHSTISSLNPQPNNPNRLHMWYKAKYSAKAGMVQDFTYGNDNNAKSGSMCLMPTRHLLELYDEQVDARYRAWFREEYYLNKASYSWTADDLAAFEKPASMVGTAISSGQLALLYTKQKIADKRNKPYAVVDIDDTYNGDRVSANARFNICFPSLLKFNDPNLPTPNSSFGTKDVFVMRFPEMYFIAAECELMMSGGSKTKAIELINVIRKRAAVAGKENDMLISESQLTQDFLLDEKARELCGEHLRWFDLKRTGKLYDYVKAYNKDIPLIQPFHVLRPIPQMFLDAITNAAEFGQNTGY
ncbi:MAG TPA: RagB/SusD family nutrient uptake outer membrane protein [Niabella sp.]|nr:RagB/SusD family nutrient uptake outer membrane protein [Niabella sp.]HQW15095.1 RagB/SusD family nutrient uptake outer membrane protein [Niabella sp.]HQX20236.1 RagB/SusD family nutrient uptake outer membrane protein [Niabella sp.]HRB07357.1 RagB/SusD family nutrient uptake outer membrane protein [Niabella sp.]HRB35548.1 RagB/SusD family nutrient uptake outer membrane protein [Niabella sp.]